MKKGITILFLLVFHFFIGNAQTTNSKHFTVADNLPSNICYKILQDEKNYIWIATEKGIVVFNGYDFKPLYLKNKLGNLDIWGLFKDSDNRIWLKSKQNNNFYIFQNKVYTIDSSYEVMLEYATKMLIYKKGEDDAIYKIDKKQKLVRISIPRALKKIIINNNEETKIIYYEFNDDNISFLLKNGNYIKYNFGKKNIEIEQSNLPVNHLLTTSVYTENITKKYYFSTKDSIYAVQQQKIKPLIKNKINQAKFIGSTSNYFFCIQNDELKILDQKFNLIDYFLPKFESPISQIYEDKEHNLWIVTIGNGIYFIANKALENVIFQKQNGLLDNNILSIELKNKELLLGYYSQTKIQKLQDRKFINIEKGVGIANHIVSLKANDIIVTDNYLSKEVEKVIPTNFNCKVVKNTNSYKLNLSIKSIFKINDTAVLIGSLNKLLLLRKSNRVLFIDSLNILPSNIYAICKTKNSILLGTPDGLFSFKHNKLKFLGKNDKHLKSNIRSIVVDKFEKIWVASDLGNLTCYDTELNKIISFDNLNGLITSLNIDTFSNSILASSSYGLYRISLSKPLNIIHYTISDGLPSNEVNATLADENYFYVATSMGLCKLKKSNQVIPYTLNLNIEKLRINNIELDAKPILKVKYEQNNIQIELAALSFQSFGQIKYYYRLNEKNKVNEWSVGMQRSILFSRLEPGEYIFEAFAKDINNVKSNLIKIKLNIIPPFWKTTLFYFLLTFFLLGAILFVMFLRLKRSKEKAVNEISIKKEFAELKLNALQSQLNSHFIYNSLNAIQKFILNKDEITASEYMSKFARMIRLFLESSRNKLTPLQKEIELISIYTSLEKLRFDDKFEVFINTNDLKEKNILFPTNLLQPFIENAIIHGLVHKTTKGRLDIYFSDKNDEIYCKIEDDGIGRKKSSEINNNKQRKSLGIEIIKDKIINIENLNDMKIKIDIIDKNLNTHTSEGTIINLYYKK